MQPTEPRELTISGEASVDRRSRRVISAHVASLAAAALLVSLAPGAHSSYPDSPKILLKTGDTTSDGTVLSSFEGVMSAEEGSLAFLGMTSALLTVNDGTISVIVRTGDALPSPLTGRFSSFGDPAMNESGAVAFTAELDSPDADAGVFLYADGALEPIALGSLFKAPPAISSDRYVAYGTGAKIYLWDRVTGLTTLVAERSRRRSDSLLFRRLGASLAVNDAGVVAFTAEPWNRQDAIFAWSPSKGLVEIYSLDSYNKYPFSINDRSQIAFSRDTETVLIHDLDSDKTCVIAKVGDLVGAEPLRSRLEVIGIDSNGKVAFVGKLNRKYHLILAANGTLTALASGVPRASYFGPVLTDTGAVTWRSSDERYLHRYYGGVTTVLQPAYVTPIGPYVTAGIPTISGSNLVAFAATRRVLYRQRDGKSPEPVAAPGDPSPGAGILSAIGPHKLEKHTLVFLAADDRGAILLANRRGKTLIPVVSSGQASPTGGMFTLSDFLTCLRPGGCYYGFDNTVGISGSRVVFKDTAVDNTGESRGVFRASIHKKKIEVLASEGKRETDGSMLRLSGRVIAQPEAATFTAYVTCASTEGSLPPTDDCICGERIFSTRRGRRLTVAAAGEQAPGGGIFYEFSSVRRAGKGILFGALLATEEDLSCDPTSWCQYTCTPDLHPGIFAASGGRLSRIAVTGDRPPKKTAGTLTPDANTFASYGSRVVWYANLQDGDFETALFTSRKNGKRARRLVATGDPAPDGMMISGFEWNYGEGQGLMLTRSATAFFGRVSPPESSSQGLYGIFLKRGGRLVPVVRTGDPTPLGGTVEFLEASNLIGLAGNKVIYRAQLDGARAREAVIVASP